MGKAKNWYSSKPPTNLADSYGRIKGGYVEDDYDDYYGENYGYSGYSGYTPQKKYKWTPTTWSSYTFKGFYDDDDDNSGLFVKDPINYITPTSNEIKNKINIWTKSALDTVKELTRVTYLKMVDDKDYISDRFADYDSLSDGEKLSYQQKKELYDNIYDQFIPGATPLEQAIAIYHQIGKKLNDQQGDPLSSSKKVPKFERLDFSFDRDLYTDATINEQLELNELSKEMKVDVMNRISIIGDLGSQFKVEKEVDEKIVAHSDTTAKRLMTNYGQIPSIDLYQRLFPNYRQKLLTKDLVVTVPVERKEKKQKIIILLDFSGSMDEYEKQLWVNALLIDRFRYVMKGEAEVFFSYFINSTSQLFFHHIKDRQDVINFWSTFSNEPNGGGTRIGEIVQYVRDEIVEHKRLHNLQVDLSEEKPEILIVNDGQIGLGIQQCVPVIPLIAGTPKLHLRG